MIYKQEINISEIIELSSDNEKESLFKEMLFDRLSEQSRNKMLKYWMNDLMESEIEFDENIKLIDAYDTIIKSMK
jgi:hypothetical protein